jgi:hypothetical protein
MREECQNLTKYQKSAGGGYKIAFFLAFVNFFNYSMPASALSPLTTEPWVRGGLATKADVSVIATLVPLSQKGAADGVASLGADGKVPEAQLPAMPNGEDYLLKSGGTMTGAINMGAQKITNLGAPTETTDGVTKKYVDDIVAQSAGGLNGTAPSWAEMNAADWESSNWGDTWEATTADNSIKVEGVAASLGNAAEPGEGVPKVESGLVYGKPRWSKWGRNCYCRISRVNDERVVGAWAFDYSYSSRTDCHSYCALYCSYCVVSDAGHSCSRAALFAAP